jgi:hypothetical protein
MCHGPTARPPMPPVSGGAGGGRRVVLEASDGNRFAAFSATTEILDAPGVVILPDVRGLHPFYEELALRFGDAGVHALALDYYGRTAGTGAAAATSTISRTSKRRPMPTSVSTWWRPWPTCARRRGAGSPSCSRWGSALVAGSRSIRRRAPGPGRRRRLLRQGGGSRAWGPHRPGDPGTEVPVPGVGPVRRRRPRDHGRARCGLSGGA